MRCGIETLKERHFPHWTHQSLENWTVLPLDEWEIFNACLERIYRCLAACAFRFWFFVFENHIELELTSFVAHKMFWKFLTVWNKCTGYFKRFGVPYFHEARLSFKIFCFGTLATSKSWRLCSRSHASIYLDILICFISIFSWRLYQIFRSVLLVIQSCHFQILKRCPCCTQELQGM